MKKKSTKKAATNEVYNKRIIQGLRSIMQQMDIHSRKLDKNHGITVPQLICLYEIYEKGATTLSLLSKNVHLASSTLVGIIDRLEEKKFIKRKRSKEDRRAIFIDITDNGREFVQTSPQLLHNRLREQLSELSNEEQIIIANSIDLLVQMLSDN